MNCPWLNKVSFNPSAAGGRVNTNKPVRGSNGTFHCKTSDILDEWKEFFSSLLNGTLFVTITEAEIVEAIKKIKHGKAPGPDNIPPEVMKADTGVTANIKINPLQNALEK